MRSKTDLVLGIGFLASGVLILSIVFLAVIPQININANFGLIENQNTALTNTNNTLQLINSNNTNTDSLHIVKIDSNKIPTMAELWSLK